jgi:hypothetical protein
VGKARTFDFPYREITTWKEEMAETSRSYSNHLASLVRYVVLALVYAVGIFWALLWLVWQPLEFLKNPRGYFSAIKRRTTLPAILHDPALGQHGYLQLAVNIPTGTSTLKNN